ncbi:hypothetical protein [Nesterenkonia rhizosphaerae]|uniref:Uncharacterized protein n=1 Tax=Nesterenkonia rhizosphaerae TaxID=1348272 RepID=A0ABP9G0E1_9MICC
MLKDKLTYVLIPMAWTFGLGFIAAYHLWDLLGAVIVAALVALGTLLGMLMSFHAGKAVAYGKAKEYNEDVLTALGIPKDQAREKERDVQQRWESAGKSL